MFLKSLSGRFLLLTIIFVMIAEILIFMPSIARFRVDYLTERLERSQIASFAVLASPETGVDVDFEEALLRNANVLSIAKRQDGIRELVLALPMPGMIEQTYDLRNESALVLIRDALQVLWRFGIARGRDGFEGHAKPYLGIFETKGAACSTWRSGCQSVP